jgi:hypothetical protein
MREDSLIGCFQRCLVIAAISSLGKCGWVRSTITITSFFFARGVQAKHGFFKEKSPITAAQYRLFGIEPAGTFSIVGIFFARLVYICFARLVCWAAYPLVYFSDTLITISTSMFTAINNCQQS